MMRTIMLSSIFILFQSATLRNFFGIRVSGVLIIFAGYALAVVVTQIMTLVIYSMTNSRPRRKNLVKMLAIILFAPLVGAGVWYIANSGGDLQSALLDLMRSPIASFTPIVGWAAAGSVAFVTGNIVMGGLYFGFLFLTGAILVIVICAGNPDYYEDVLVASETAFEKMRTVAEGQINTEAISDKQVHIKATGIEGFGASAIFHRHIRESFRANRFGLWGISTLLLAAGSAAYALIQIYTGDSSGDIISIFITAMFFQLFLINTGRGLRDIYSHYIFLIPENPFKKLIWSNIEIMLKIAVQNLLIFAVAGIILNASPLLIIMPIVTCTLFAFVLLAINYLSLRFTGADMSYGLLIMLYLIPIVIVMAPGVVAVILLSIFIEGFTMIHGFIVLSAWEIVVGLGCFAAAKGILHTSEMQVIPENMKSNMNG